jgi:hypothetical protein
MGTAVRASAAIKIDEVTITDESVRIGVRLREVKLTLVGESDSPVATLIKSGALDLSKPGNLVKFIPKSRWRSKPRRSRRHDHRVPEAQNPRVKKLLGLISPVLGIRAIETDRDHLYVKLRAMPAGLPEALGKLRTAR